MVVPAQLLPSGFALPPLPYLLGLLLAVAAVLMLLYRVEPAVTPRVVAAFGLWMVGGATGYALFQAEAVPAALEPLFGSPAVYLSTFVVAGLVWAGATRFPADTWAFPSAPSVLLLTGALTAGGLVGTALVVGQSRGGLSLLLPGLGLVLSAVVSGVIWALLRRRRPQVSAAGAAGGLVVFGHTVDGISTAIGTDLMGFGEQTPLSRLIIEFGAGLPTAPYLGSAWPFVLVKIALAAFVLVFLAEYVEEEPRQGLLLVGLVAAVGLGPGVHNLVLFAIA
jgi:uncharacterized membrane protein